MSNDLMGHIIEHVHPDIVLERGESIIVMKSWRELDERMVCKQWHQSLRREWIRARGRNVHLHNDSCTWPPLLSFPTGLTDESEVPDTFKEACYAVLTNAGVPRASIEWMGMERNGTAEWNGQATAWCTKVEETLIAINNLHNLDDGRNLFIATFAEFQSLVAIRKEAGSNSKNKHWSKQLISKATGGLHPRGRAIQEGVLYVRDEE